MEQIDLTDFFSTRSQATDFAARLSLVAEKTYELDFDLEKSLQKQFGIIKKDKFITLLRKNEIPLDSRSDLNSFLENIQNLISDMSTADITLAIDPSDEILKNISNWFLLKLNKQILLDINIDPKIIAGASIGFQGKQLDASIGSLFNEVSRGVLNNNNQKP